MWKINLLESGHNSLDNAELEMGAFSAVFERVKEYFGARLHVGSMVGMDMDSLAEEITVDNVLLTIGWDSWSGVYVMAHDIAGDKILDEIALILNK